MSSGPRQAAGIAGSSRYLQPPETVRKRSEILSGFLILIFYPEALYSALCGQNVVKDGKRCIKVMTTKMQTGLNGYRKPFALTAGIGILFALLTGCTQQAVNPEEFVSRQTDPDAVLFTFEEGQVTLDDFAKWYLVHGNMAYLPEENHNETQWIQSHVKEMTADVWLSHRARQMELDETEEMQQKYKELVDEAVTRLYIKENITDKVTVTELDIDKYYEENKEEYRQEPSFSFKMIFFDAIKHGRDKARRMARRVKERLDNGASFDSLIHENSDINEIHRNDVFGPYKPGEGLLPEIEQAAMLLEQGQISDIIEHKKGFHLIKIVGKIEAKLVPKAELRQTLWGEVYKRKMEQREKQLLAEKESDLDIMKNFDIIQLPIARPNDVVYRVDDEKLTLKDYYEIQQEGTFQTEDDFLAEFNRKMRNMTYRALARKEGLAQKPEVAEWVNIFFNRELVRLYLDNVVNDELEVTDEEVEQYYEQYKNSFRDPRMVYARHIYIPIQTRDGMSRYELIRELQSAKNQAYQVIWKIREGMPFEEACRLYSHSPDAMQGGVLGWIPFGQSVRFDKSVTNLEEGEITTEPVSRRRGYQILMVEKKADFRQQSLDEAWDEAYNRIFYTRSTKDRSTLLDNLMLEADIKIDSEVARDVPAHVRKLHHSFNIYTINEN
jgi:peptidyl-prolyl cis-trans isomerase C